MINIKNSLSRIPMELYWADQSDTEYRTFCKRKAPPVTNMGCLTQQYFPGFQQLPAQGLPWLLSIHTGIHINCSANPCKLNAFKNLTQMVSQITYKELKHHLHFLATNLLLISSYNPWLFWKGQQILAFYRFSVRYSRHPTYLSVVPFPDHREA